MTLTPLKVSFSRKVQKKRSWCPQDMGWTLENILDKGIDLTHIPPSTSKVYIQARPDSKNQIELTGREVKVLTFRLQSARTGSEAHWQYRSKSPRVSRYIALILSITWSGRSAALRDEEVQLSDPGIWAHWTLRLSCLLWCICANAWHAHNMSSLWSHRLLAKTAISSSLSVEQLVGKLLRSTLEQF